MGDTRLNMHAIQTAVLREFVPRPDRELCSSVVDKEHDDNAVFWRVVFP